jgi:hypothetical protein
MDKQTEKQIAHRFEKITKLNGGRLTPEAVVEDARDSRSPLHSQFEWDDAKAAHHHRLDRARELIRSVRVDRSVTARNVAVRYVRDPSATSKEQGYRDVVSLRDEKDAAREVVEAEVRRIVAAIERAMGIAEVLGLTDELERLLAEVERVRARAAA